MSRLGKYSLVWTLAFLILALVGALIQGVVMGVTGTFEGPWSVLWFFLVCSIVGVVGMCADMAIGIIRS